MYKFLLDYRTTPHCTTGVPPATAFFGRSLRNRLPAVPAPRCVDDFEMRTRDFEQKANMKRYADNKNYVTPSTIDVGDSVLLKNTTRSKALTPFQPTPLVIIAKKGTMLTAQRGFQKVTRNSSFFKRSPRAPLSTETDPDQTELVVEADEPTITTPHAHTTPSNHSHPIQRPEPEPMTLRRSGREVSMPKKFEDFVMMNGKK